MLPNEKMTFPRGLYLWFMKLQNILKLQLLEVKCFSPKLLGKFVLGFFLLCS